MNSKRKEELEEQYEDALFALMMHDYAEAEGNRLLQEYEEALANGEVEEVPAELDARCRNMIQQAYNKSRRKESAIQFWKSVSRVAVVALVMLGICTTLVLSVEALRVPVLNFIIAQTEQFTSIGNTDGKQPSENEAATVDHSERNSSSPLEGILPDSFELINSRIYDDGTFLYFYRNEEGSTVAFDTELSEGLLNSDTENAISEAISIGGYEGIFIEEGSKLKVVWFDAEKSLAYQFRTSNVDVSEFWIWAESLAKSVTGW